MKKLFAILMLLVLAASGSLAGTINVPADQPTIQAAVDAALPGDVINIAPGTYTEAVIINKHVDLIGAGSGTNPAVDTIITCNSGVGPRIFTMEASGASAADPILFQDMRLEPDSVVGFEIHNTQVIAFVKLDNVKVDGTNQTNDTESEIGIRVATDGTLTDLVVNNCTFDHLTYGWYFAKSVGTTTVSGVTVTNSSFSNNDSKGLYVEKLENATFTGCTVHNNGINTSFWNGPWNGGFDINLKYGDYANLTFSGCTFSDNGKFVKEGAGLLLKGRGTGTLDLSYAANPATLDNVLVEGCTFTGNERGVRFGEPGKDNTTPTNAVVSGCTIMNNVQTYVGVDGSSYGGVVNQTTAPTEAAGNWWGDNDPSDQFSGLGAVDVSPWLGAVPGTSPMTWYVNATGTIQAAIDAADPGDFIEVAAGTYVEALLIEKELTLNGATAGVNKNGYTVPTDYLWDDTVESIIQHPGGAYVAIVDIYDTDNVTFDGFVVEELNAVANTNTSLVRVYALTAAITNINVVNNIIGPNTNVVAQDGKQGRMGLYIVNHPYGDFGVMNSSFARNKIFDCKGNGDNVFLWTSYYSYGAPGPADMAGTFIEDNEIYGSHRAGIETAGGFANLTIRNNTIYGQTGLPADDPDFLKYGHGIQLIRGSSDKVSDPLTAFGPVNLTITGNEIHGNQKCGIYMGPKNEDIFITDNVIHDNGWNGVMLDLEGNYWNPQYESPPVSGDYACFDCSEDVSVTENEIYDNGLQGHPLAHYGIQMVGTPTNAFQIEAEANWWGDATGPLDASDDTGAGGLYNPGGQGDEVTDLVLYEPWVGPAAGDIVPVTTGPLNCSQTIILTFSFTADEFTPDMFLYNAVVNATPGLIFGDVEDLEPFGTVNNNFFAMSTGANQWTITGSTVGNPSYPVSGVGTTGLFTIEFSATGDVAGSVEFESLTLRDPANNTIPVDLTAATITYDCTAPAAVTGITAAPGHNKVDVSWTHNLVDVDHFEVYRGLWYDTTVGNSAYPEYDDVGAIAPTRPSDHEVYPGPAGEWIAAGSTATPVNAFTDLGDDGVDPVFDADGADRGVYYYEVFAVDAAGNPSAVAPANDRATNYWLGDVTGIPSGYPNGLVQSYDITALADAFGTTDGDASGDYDNVIDVGPTYDWSPLGIPTTDSKINFEDLMVFSMNFGVVGASKTAPPISQKIDLAWVRYDDGRQALRLVDGSGVKGLNVRADMRVTDVVAGELLDAQSELTFLKNVGKVLDVSVAVTGRNVGFVGSGDLFVVDAADMIDVNDLTIKVRGYDNSRLEYTMDEKTGSLAPRVFALNPNYPNPFNPMTKISFSLPEAQDVRLDVFGIDGRKVATLLNESRGPGLHEVVWTGQDDSGRAVASGTYFYRIEAGPYSSVHKMTLMK